MAYVCIDKGEVVSVLNYKPEVPAAVTVVEISDRDYNLLQARTHKFNVMTNTVEPNVVDETALMIDANLKFLRDTDWMVLRHIRETTLGIPTSLTQEVYLRLEHKRQEAAKSI